MTTHTFADYVADIAYLEINREELQNATFYCLLHYLTNQEQAEPTNN